MTFEVTGVITEVSEIKSGLTQDGREWQRCSILVAVAGSCGTFSNIKLDASNREVDEITAIGAGVKVHLLCTIYARQWQERWFNCVEVVRILSAEDAAPSVPGAAAPAAPSSATQSENDLPF